MVLQEMHTLLIYLLLMYITVHDKIFLKITKVKSEAVFRRRIDNIIAKGKKDNMTNNDLQNITQKTKDRATNATLKTQRGTQVLFGFCSTRGTPRVTRVIEPILC
jgi:hypothetical protein